MSSSSLYRCDWRDCPRTSEDAGREGWTSLRFVRLFDGFTPSYDLCPVHSAHAADLILTTPQGDQPTEET